MFEKIVLEGSSIICFWRAFACSIVSISKSSLEVKTIMTFWSVSEGGRGGGKVKRDSSYLMFTVQMGKALRFHKNMIYAWLTSYFRVLHPFEIRRGIFFSKWDQCNAVGSLKNVKEFNFMLIYKVSFEFPHGHCAIIKWKPNFFLVYGASKQTLSTQMSYNDNIHRILHFRRSLGQVMMQEMQKRMNSDVKTSHFLRAKMK